MFVYGVWYECVIVAECNSDAGVGSGRHPAGVQGGQQSADAIVSPRMCPAKELSQSPPDTYSN